MALIFQFQQKMQKKLSEWLYFGYLGAIKDQNGAAMSLGRTSTFLDIYFERDFKAGSSTAKKKLKNNLTILL